MQYSKEEVDVHRAWAAVMGIFILGTAVAIIFTTNKYYASCDAYIKQGYVQTFRGYWVRPEHLEVKSGYPEVKE